MEKEDYWTKIQQLRSEKKVKVIENTVNINGTIFKIKDIKLNCYCPLEDKIFKNNEIRKLIPRGLCFVFHENSIIHVLCGHPKFGYDGEYHEDNKKGIISKKIFLEKENGEAGHVSGFIFNFQKYLIFGSKNVHIVIREDEPYDDILLYSSDRFKFATLIANAAIKLHYSSFSRIIDYCFQTKFTLCFEACFLSSEHLVKYSEDVFYFFAITGIRSETDGITKLSPYEAFEIFISMELKPVRNMRISNTIEFQKEHETYFENCENSEGAVVVCMDENNIVVYVYKHKNNNYIIWRAVREQLKNRASIEKLMIRFVDFHVPVSEKIMKEIIQFANYFYSLSEDIKNDFFSKYVTYRNIFKSSYFDESIETIVDLEISKKTTIILVGFPGSGKSTIARFLSFILSHNGKQNIKYLEQDMFSHKGKRKLLPKESSKLYHAALKDSFENHDINIIISSKSNHSLSVREKLYEQIGNSKRFYIVLNTEDILSTCTNRIMLRGEFHTTLKGKSEKEIENILTNVFIKHSDPLSIDELNFPHINIDINESLEKIIQDILGKLFEDSIIPEFEFSRELFLNAMEFVDEDNKKLNI
jgi:tRNA uridine 5-carbamoylmethylation protein Kti12